MAGYLAGRRRIGSIERNARGNRIVNVSFVSSTLQCESVKKCSTIKKTKVCLFALNEWLPVVGRRPWAVGMLAVMVVVVGVCGRAGCSDVEPLLVAVEKGGEVAPPGQPKGLVFQGFCCSRRAKFWPVTAAGRVSAN
jgi:hypothetical protein